MCGIFGIIDRSGRRPPSAERLKASIELMRHRGPDANAIYSDDSIGLSHTRLALVDLDDRSNQPLWSDDRRYCLLYNGEVYNYRKLRTGLEAQGVSFRTTGDTEVLLQSLIHDGSRKTLPKLEGMFAFAFLDLKEGRVFLARDRFGMKPLHLYVDDESILFASEVRAMRPWIDLEPDPFAVAAYLVNSPASTRPGSFFQNVKSLQPGSLIVCEPGREPRAESFFQVRDFLDPSEAEDLGRLEPVQVVDRFDELLQEAVEQMLSADVPIGVLCSGGVDSSLVLAMAARRHADLAIFHANVKGPLSELPAAQALAKELGLDLKVVDVEDRDFIDLSPRVTAHYERPYQHHAHSLPFLRVAQLVHDSGIKGVLSGEGSDEAFLGYRGLGYRPLLGFYSSLVARLERLVQAIPRFGAILWPPDGSEARLAGSLLSRLEIGVAEQANRDAYFGAFRRQPGQETLTLDLFEHPLRLLLHRNDAMGMACRIESRFPFLSEPLIKAAVNLPVKYKVRLSPRGVPANLFYRDKWVVRKVAERYLPRNLSERKKWPFRVSALDRIRIAPPYFRGSWVADFLGLGERELAHLAGRNSSHMSLKLMMLDLWGQLCIEGGSEEVAASRLGQWASFEN